MKLTYTKNAFMCSALALTIALMGGCAKDKEKMEMEKDVCLAHLDEKTDYLFSGHIKRVADKDTILFSPDRHDVSSFKVGAAYTHVSAYRDAPERFAKNMPLKCMIGDMHKRKHLKLDTIWSNPETKKVVFSKTHRVWTHHSATLGLKHHINPETERAAEFKPGQKYNLRFIYLGKGEDHLFFAKDGITIIRNGHKDFSLAVKDIGLAYVITSEGKKFIPKHNIKAAVAAMNSNSYALNGDIALPDSLNKYIVFKMGKVHYNEERNTLTMRIKPLDDRENMSFFNSIKEEKTLPGAIDFHVDFGTRG